MTSFPFSYFKYILFGLGAFVLASFLMPVSLSCNMKEEDGYAKVNFVGHDLILPVEQVQYCTSYPNGSDPARIVLSFMFPGFGAPPYGPPPLENRDQINVHFLGFLERKQTTANVGASATLAKQFEHEITWRISDKFGREISKYQKAVKTKDGLEFYKGNWEDRTEDMYIGRNADGVIDLMLKCGDKGCSSGPHLFYPNATYTYYFDKTHLHDIREIDVMMRKHVLMTLLSPPL